MGYILMGLFLFWLAIVAVLGVGLVWKVSGWLWVLFAENTSYPVRVLLIWLLMVIGAWVWVRRK